MISSEEILKSMKTQMEEYKKQFDEISNEIDSTGKTYQAKIDELQQERVRLVEEGNAKLDELRAKREQISGMHAALFQQCAKIEGTTPEAITSTDKVVPIDATQKKSVNTKQKQASNKNASSKTTEGLTEEDLKKLEDIAKPTQATNTGKSDDIPDYLKEAYNKQ